MTDNRERQLLKLSVVVTLLFAGLGVLWGLAINSSVVMFDGLYSLVSVMLTSLSLLVVGQLSRPEDQRYQFGRAVLEPVVLALKSVGIASMCLYALVGAVDDLMRGGVAVRAGWGAAYALIATGAGYVGWRYLLRRNDGSSDLVQAEADQWYMDMTLSGAVLLGFIASAALGYTPYGHLTPYMDPAMVVLVAGYVIRTPLAMLIGALREILVIAPAEDLEEQARAIVLEILALPSEQVVTRQAKVGRQLMIDVGIRVIPGEPGPSVDEQDTMRQKLEDGLTATGLTPWLTLHCSAMKKWL